MTSPAEGFTVTVDVAAPPGEVFDWLSDLRNRPRWQASLRTVEISAPPPYGVGTRWLDVTWPGVCPRMEVTAFEPGSRWAERGHWHGVSVDLVLDFVERPGGTTVRATADAHGAGWRRPIVRGLGILGPVAARDDLRRAARLIDLG